MLLERLPLVGGATKLAGRVYRHALRNGWRITLKVIVNRLFGRLLSRPGVARSTRDAARVLRYYGRHGLRPTAWQVWYHVLAGIRPRRVSDAGTTGTLLAQLPGEALRALEQVQLLRALGAAEELLEFHETKVLAGSATSAPLALLRRFLSERGLDESAAERGLVDLLARQPSFAEAWLELGYIHLDGGRGGRANECFKRAAIEQSKLLPTQGDGSARAKAWAEIALQLDAGGQSESARNAYERSLAEFPTQSMLRVGYGQMLRRLGQFQAAGRQFAAAISYEGTLHSLPKVPRRFQDLVFDTLATVPDMDAKAIEPSPARRAKAAAANE
jgi:hypothetical protein